MRLVSLDIWHHFILKDIKVCSIFSTPTLYLPGEQPSVTLTRCHLQDLKLCDKDHQKLAELLESEQPSQHLLVVQPKHEQVEVLPLQGM